MAMIEALGSDSDDFAMAQSTGPNLIIEEQLELLVEQLRQELAAQQAPTSRQAAVSSQQGSTTSNCVVRCNRRCSYPGHCRKYTDSNNYGKCDLGQCV